jgi:hypothetical protein
VMFVDLMGDGESIDFIFMKSLVWSLVNWSNIT